MAEEQAERLFAKMREAFPDAVITGYERLVPVMTTHEKDRHVAAAAVVAGAQVIVTSNLRDFPRSALDPFNIVPQSPDEFLVGLVDLAPRPMVEILRAQAARLRKPPKTVEEVLDDIALQAPEFAKLMHHLVRLWRDLRPIQRPLAAPWLRRRGLREQQSLVDLRDGPTGGVGTGRPGRDVGVGPRWGSAAADTVVARLATRPIRPPERLMAHRAAVGEVAEQEGRRGAQPPRCAGGPGRWQRTRRPLFLAPPGTGTPGPIEPTQPGRMIASVVTPEDGRR